MTNQSGITSHYHRSNLFEAITDALEQHSPAEQPITADRLKGVDEFHTGGIVATEHLLAQLDIEPTTRVVDIGCGIGGAARHISINTGAKVTGIDLTPEYIDTAQSLSRLVGLGNNTEFVTGSALDLPVNSDSFELATLLHVGMNIKDKQALFKETARVLVKRGTFALFEVMQTAPGALNYPLPWATLAEQSFVASRNAYAKAAGQAGFELIYENNRKEFAVEFFNKLFASKPSTTPTALNLQLLMGPDTPIKLKNYAALINNGQLAPVEMIFRKSASMN